jgi:predicted ATPase
MLASERAERLFAWREVMGQTQRALALLEALPEGPERTRSEQTLLQRRVRSIIAQHGYASSEVEPLSRRLAAIAEQLGDGYALRMARFALFGFYVTRADYEKADELADWVVQESEQTRDAEAKVTAAYIKGMLLFILGRFSEARELLEPASSLCPLDHGPSRFSDLGLLQDPDVSALTTLACVLACLGFPEQALRRSDEAILLAEKIGNPFSLAYAQDFGTVARQLVADTREVKGLSQALLALATERGVALFRAMARVLGAWARVAAGDAEEGIAALEQGLSDLGATGNQYGATYFVGVAADAYGKAGRPGDALALLRNAQERTRSSGEAVYEAELQRLEGELLLQASSEDAARAEACFAQALETARRQQAKLFELRAATSLARLWRSQRKKARARKLLAEVFGWFSEGFDSPDLREARSLLDELA